jgi:hypothetical protein
MMARISASRAPRQSPTFAIIWSIFVPASSVFTLAFLAGVFVMPTPRRCVRHAA